jgi:hypothetical protein
MLTSDHDFQDPFERLSWGGIIVYHNAILKLSVFPEDSYFYYFKKRKMGTYLGNPNNQTMGCITVGRLKNLMEERIIDVSVVDVASIFKSTQYQREINVLH